MLGVLVKGDLDDGRGRARVNLFRHKHEIETGRTSSVGMEIMGFDTTGHVITSDTPGRMFYCALRGTVLLMFHRQTFLGRNRQAQRKGYHFY